MCVCVCVFVCEYRVVKGMYYHPCTCMCTISQPSHGFVFFLQAHGSAPAGPKIVLMPPQSNFKYMFICT